MLIFNFITQMSIKHDRDRETINFLLNCYDKEIDETKLKTVRRVIKKYGRNARSILSTDAAKIICTTVAIGFFLGSGLSLVNNYIEEKQTLKKENKGLVMAINDIQSQWITNKNLLEKQADEIQIYKQITTLSAEEKVEFDSCIAPVSRLQFDLIKYKRCLYKVDS